MVQASKAEALVAVDFYNTTGERRSFEAFVVHMHLAWLYLLHAEFLRDGTDFRYWSNRGGQKRLQRVDGDPKTWDLARSVLERWPAENEPVRRNLEFFIGLRNKIEHRYQEPIGLAVAGHAQAQILNFEKELVEQFGVQEGLADRLRFPVFLTSLTREGIDATRTLRARLPANATRYIRDFHEGLDAEVGADPRFEFRIHLVPQLGPKSEADMAVRFVPEAELTSEQRAAIAAIGSGVIATRTKREPVQNLGRFKPSHVVRRVREVVPGFSMGDFIWSWKHYAVRPPAGDPEPHKTDVRYCVWDEPHGDYLYTEAWVKKLVKRYRT